MANSKSARKRARQGEQRRARNMALRSRMRTAMKKVLKAVASGDHEQARAEFRRATPLIDGMVSKGLVHRNRAARHKSRLNARIRSLGA